MQSWLIYWNSTTCIAVVNGERGLLDSSIFEVDSGSIAFAALDALESEGGRNAVDAVICGGLKTLLG